MRRVLSLLLTAAMVLSLLVVAGAEQQTVTLKTAKSVNGSEVTYTFTLDATGSDGVGALSFYVETTGLTFKKVVYNNGGTELDKVFKPSTVGEVGEDGAYGFYEKMGRFFAYGGDYKTGRLLKGEVVLVAVTYTIDDPAYGLTIKTGAEGFKACYSGERHMTDTGKYNCVAAEITDSGSTGDYDITPVGKGDNTPAYEVEGTSLTVTYSLACAVAYSTDGGATYTRISATSASDGSYVYDLSAVPANAKIIVVVKGDVNGDGKVNSKDVTRLRQNIKSPATYPLDEGMTEAANVNGDTKVNGKDVTRLRQYIKSPNSYPLG